MPRMVSMVGTVVSVEELVGHEGLIGDIRMAHEWGCGDWGREDSRRGATGERSRSDVVVVKNITRTGDAIRVWVDGPVRLLCLHPAVGRTGEN